MGRLVGRALVSFATVLAATLLFAPPVTASPIGDAEAAIMAAWEKAGGETSTLGARKGDVYPVAEGFALAFANGKMFYTPDTGAKLLYGPILDKYESLGGPADSDLGFPTLSEIPGLAGPDSRVSTFSASDKPVIYWTPEHGAHVVRGAINSAWDRLGSSGGVLGVPVGDEGYDGEVISQKFNGGELSWNRQTKKFTTVPPNLADQLADLQVVVDPGAAIGMAWRATGGATGPLGAKQGGQYPIGGDGVAQNFAGGKIFYSPATGANAVESEILAKYEALGGPVSSDLGFPTANESDGGFGSSSRISTFSASDKPVIFWTPDHGAQVVRGAIKAAWDKLRGPAGKLGAPVADQTTDGDVISQKFTGGKISWDRTKNSFSTDPANLAPLLSGLQVPGQNQPSVAATTAHPAKKFAWHWWYLVGVVPVLVLVALVVLVTVGLRRRRRNRAAQGDAGYQPPHDQADHDLDGLAAGYQPAADGHWGPEEGDRDDEYFAVGNPHSRELTESASGSGISWSRGAETFGEPGEPDEAYRNEVRRSTGERYGDYADHEALGDYAEYGDYGDYRESAGYGEFEGEFEPEDDDFEVVDTTPIAPESVLRNAGAQSVADVPGLYPPDVPQVARPEPVVPEYPEFGMPDILVPESAVHEAELDVYEVGDTGDVHDVDDHADDDVDDRADDHVDDRESLETAYAEVVPPRADVSGARSGRHAAADPDEDLAVAPELSDRLIRRSGRVGRPALHLPLSDPYQQPDGYPIKASARFGLYYTPGSALYHDTIAEVWFASEDVAQANGFSRAD